MHEIFQQVLKDFKFDTSAYLNLPPLGIRDAVIEECARIAEQCGSPVIAAEIRNIKTK